MIKKILVPSGIGDFSWTWSKLVTTGDQYYVNYMGGLPDRMHAYLSLLPKDKIIGFAADHNHSTGWDDYNLIVLGKDGHPNAETARRYAELDDKEYKFFECNSFLESGCRLEDWLKNEIPETEFHYKINGTVPHPGKGKYFVVNFSSYGTKKAWGYYEVEDSADVVEFIYRKKHWMPVFIGGYYDDYTMDICKMLVERDVPVMDLVGKTPELLAVIGILQQSKLYFGACSGLMAIANVLYVPTIVYYPPFKRPPGRFLSGMWHDRNVLHIGMFWEGKLKDMDTLENNFKLIK